MASDDLNIYAPATRALLESSLDATTIRVILWLATFADFKTGENARPALNTIATRLHLHRRTVIASLNKAVAAGWLSAVKQRGPKREWKPTVYACKWLAALVAAGSLGSGRQTTRVVAHGPPGSDPATTQPTPLTESQMTEPNHQSFAVATTKKMLTGERASKSEQRAAAVLLVWLYNGRCPDLRRYELPKDFTPPVLLKALRWRSIFDWRDYFDKAHQCQELETMHNEGPADLLWLVRQDTVARLEADNFEDLAL